MLKRRSWRCARNGLPWSRPACLCNGSRSLENGSHCVSRHRNANFRRSIRLFNRRLCPKVIHPRHLGQQCRRFVRHALLRSLYRGGEETVRSQRVVLPRRHAGLFAASAQVQRNDREQYIRCGVYDDALSVRIQRLESGHGHLLRFAAVGTRTLRHHGRRLENWYSSFQYLSESDEQPFARGLDLRASERGCRENAARWRCGGFGDPGRAVGESCCARFVAKDNAAEYLERVSGVVGAACDDVAVWNVWWYD